MDSEKQRLHDFIVMHSAPSVQPQVQPQVPPSRCSLVTVLRTLGAVALLALLATHALHFAGYRVRVSLESATESESKGNENTLVQLQSPSSELLPQIFNKCPVRVKLPEPAQEPVQLPLDAQLRLNEFQYIATHNSYHIKPIVLGPIVKEWDYTHDIMAVSAEKYGIRGFEIDVHAKYGGLQVYHVNIVDDRTNCACFESCLASIKQFSDANRGHFPIIVHMEPKSGFERGVYDDLERVILNVFPRNQILIPDDVRGDYPDLYTAITTAGWPTLAQSRGRVIFLTMGTELELINYGFFDSLSLNPSSGELIYGLDYSLRGRLFFPATRDIDRPFTSFPKLDSPIGDVDLIAAALKDGFIVRTFLDHGADKEAISSGAHVLSTDFEKNLNWIGSPVRCNPVSASALCSNAALESLKL